MQPLLLTPIEAADVLRVGRSTLYLLMDTGELQYVRVRSVRRIPATALAEFVERLAGRV